MMNQHLAKPPRWYWVVAILILLWAVLGVLSFFADPGSNEAVLAEMSDAQRELFAQRPGWIFAIYGLAVFASLAGALGLILRRRFALPAFALSLLLVVVQFAYVLFVLDAIGRLGLVEAAAFPMVILVIGMFSLWLSWHARSRGWFQGR
jgi:hypothetical protein